jgi:hypothetical protein
MERPAGTFFRHAAFILWTTIRFPMLVFLVTLEPLVAFCLGALALLGILVSAILEFSGAIPHFHLALMLGISIGCGLLLVVYHALIRLISR